MTRRIVIPLLVAATLVGCADADGAQGNALASGSGFPERAGEQAWWERVEVVAEPVVAVAADAGAQPTDPVPVAPCTKEFRVPSDVLFASGSSQLAPAAGPQVSDLVALLSGAIEVTVAGATDSVGSPSSNLDLSVRRAESVATALAAAGFTKAPVSTVGWGEDQPVADENGPDPATARARNRRVVVIAVVPCS